MGCVLYLRNTIVCLIPYFIYTTILYLFFGFFEFFTIRTHNDVDEGVVNENDKL
jgi:hypothetical protein